MCKRKRDLTHLKIGKGPYSKLERGIVSMIQGGIFDIVMFDFIKHTKYTKSLNVLKQNIVLTYMAGFAFQSKVPELVSLSTFSTLVNDQLPKVSINQEILAWMCANDIKLSDKNVDMIIRDSVNNIDNLEYAINSGLISVITVLEFVNTSKTSSILLSKLTPLLTKHKTVIDEYYNNKVINGKDVLEQKLKELPDSSKAPLSTVGGFEWVTSTKLTCVFVGSDIQVEDVNSTVKMPGEGEVINNTKPEEVATGNSVDYTSNITPSSRIDFEIPDKFMANSKKPYYHKTKLEEGIYASIATPMFTPMANRTLTSVSKDISSINKINHAILSLYRTGRTGCITADEIKNIHIPNLSVRYKSNYRLILFKQQLLIKYYNSAEYLKTAKGYTILNDPEYIKQLRVSLNKSVNDVIREMYRGSAETKLLLNGRDMYRVYSWCKRYKHNLDTDVQELMGMQKIKENKMETKDKTVLDYTLEEILTTGKVCPLNTVLFGGLIIASMFAKKENTLDRFKKFLCMKFISETQKDGMVTIGFGDDNVLKIKNHILINKLVNDIISETSKEGKHALNSDTVFGWIFEHKFMLDRSNVELVKDDRLREDFIHKAFRNGYFIQDTIAFVLHETLDDSVMKMWSDITGIELKVKDSIKSQDEFLGKELAKGLGIPKDIFDKTSFNITPIRVNVKRPNMFSYINESDTVDKVLNPWLNLFDEIGNIANIVEKKTNETHTTQSNTSNGVIRKSVFNEPLRPYQIRCINDGQIRILNDSLVERKAYKESVKINNSDMHGGYGTFTLDNTLERVTAIKTYQLFYEVIIEFFVTDKLNSFLPETIVTKLESEIGLDLNLVNSTVTVITHADIELLISKLSTNGYFKEYNKDRVFTTLLHLATNNISMAKEYTYFKDMVRQYFVSGRRANQLEIIKIHMKAEFIEIVEDK